MAAQTDSFPLFSRLLLVRWLGMCALLVLSGSLSGAQSQPPQQSPHAAQPASQDETPARASHASEAKLSAAAAPQNANAVAEQPATQPAAASAPATAPAAPAVALAPATPRPPYPGMTPEDKRKQEVAQECADLLKLATDLKAQVDKARKDELSVAVVRKATELEQMAHKVRSGTALSASK